MLDERMCGMEDLKVVSAKTAKLTKDIHSIGRYGEKTRDRVRAIES